MSASVFSRFVTIVTSPGATMEVVREKPRFLVGALAVILCVGLFSAATMHISGPESIDVMRDTRYGRMMEPEQIDKMYDRYIDITVMNRVVNGISGGVGAALALFVSSLVYFLFGKLAGGRGSFAQVMGVCMWASVVSMGYGALVKWPLAVAKQSVMGVSMGPAVLVADRGLTDPIFGLLSMMDVFTLWGVVILVLGFESVHGFARNKAAMVVVATWLLMTLVMFGLGRLFI